MSVSPRELDQRRLIASQRLNKALESADQALSYSFKVQRYWSELKEQVCAVPPTVLLKVKDKRVIVKVFEHARTDAHKKCSTLL